MKTLLLILCLFLTLEAIEIKQKPIKFSKQRIELTIKYIKKHYGLTVDNIKITPKMIVVHHTALNDFERSFKRMDEEILLSDRTDISNASTLNVSAHYLIDKDGTIYSLMRDDHMGRHTIGLNYYAIGIENVGGQNDEDNLTNEQLKANKELIKYLKKKYKTIKYLIGHYEYRNFENSKLWLELDKNYRTKKTDPSVRFMNQLKNSKQAILKITITKNISKTVIEILKIKSRSIATILEAINQKDNTAINTNTTLSSVP